jgi:hypothetical protein
LIYDLRQVLIAYGHDRLHYLESAVDHGRCALLANHVPERHAA